jgi:chemotaxis signal transduction protein
MKVTDKVQNINEQKVLDGQEDKYLTFKLAKEEYGINILKIKEIIGMMPITTIPQTPEFVKGVINLRGQVFPAIDLRLLFRMPGVEYSERTCIVVVEAQKLNMKRCWIEKQCGKEGCPGYENTDHRCWMISGTLCRDEIQGSYREKIEACRQCDFYQSAIKDSAVFTIGIIVDSVSEVLSVGKDKVEDTSTFGSSLNTEYVLGIAKMEDSVKILLDIDQALGAETIAELSGMV